MHGLSCHHTQEKHGVGAGEGELFDKLEQLEASAPTTRINASDSAAEETVTMEAQKEGWGRRHVLLQPNCRQTPPRGAVPPAHRPLPPNLQNAGLARCPRGLSVPQHSHGADAELASPLATRAQRPAGPITTPAIPSPAPCVTRWPNHGRTGVMACPDRKPLGQERTPSSLRSIAGGPLLPKLKADPQLPAQRRPRVAGVIPGPQPLRAYARAYRLRAALFPRTPVPGMQATWRHHGLLSAVEAAGGLALSSPSLRLAAEAAGQPPCPVHVLSGSGGPAQATAQRLGQPPISVSFSAQGLTCACNLLLSSCDPLRMAGLVDGTVHLLKHTLLQHVLVMDVHTQPLQLKGLRTGLHSLDLITIFAPAWSHLSAFPCCPEARSSWGSVECLHPHRGDNAKAQHAKWYETQTCRAGKTQTPSCRTARPRPAMPRDPSVHLLVIGCLVITVLQQLAFYNID
ncbi:hypothetical protein QTO34_008256 [Cnephaeus nilssonii]|uniref:Uncharacterized protein n=1 Tax=Cnephaeus nilssonii TaxID=3371016 RepID=A0AA40IAE5_CNENI|nr:hypothetical protein QTO34_008256 [Eptesicus nilssonii]